MIGCNADWQAAYKDFITAVILRQNTVTGRIYRDDPNILAWDLVNEPANNGDQSGDVLYLSSALPLFCCSIGAMFCCLLTSLGIRADVTLHAAELCHLCPKETLWD